MSRSIRLAVIQMDAAPAPVTTRLDRAGDLVAEAAAAGAQLVLLPEVFNTGYEYTDRNYELAEPIDGPTVSWMRARAAQHGCYLAGTLLLLDQEDVFNSALLIAPDGRLWRYDKQYPFAHERAYFREDRHITVAETDFGKIGMMICWDAAHTDVWERYAGKVQMLLIPACPPKLSSADVVFPDGLRVNMRDLSAFARQIYTDEEYFPGADLDAHAAWLGVPVALTVGGGTFRSPMPDAPISLGALLSGRPDLWGRMAQADTVRLEAGYDKQTKIVDGQGQVVARVSANGDGYAIGVVSLPDSPPEPTRPQPRMQTSPWAYLMADVIGAGVLSNTYRRELRRRFGKRMAPVDPRTRVWVTAMAGAAAAGWLLGRVDLWRALHRTLGKQGRR